MVFSANGTGPIRYPHAKEWSWTLTSYCIKLTQNGSKPIKPLEEIFGINQIINWENTAFCISSPHTCVSIKQISILKNKSLLNFNFFLLLFAHAKKKKKVAVKVLSPNPWTTRELSYLTFKIRCFPEYLAMKSFFSF